MGISVMMAGSLKNGRRTKVCVLPVSNGLAFKTRGCYRRGGGEVSDVLTKDFGILGEIISGRRVRG